MQLMIMMIINQGRGNASVSYGDIIIGHSNKLLRKKWIDAEAISQEVEIQYG